MGTEWITQLTPIVFTRIKNGITKKTKETYGLENKNFSTSESSKTSPVFPFVHVKQLQSVEQGKDLEGTSINGGLFTYQIRVTDNQSEEAVKKITNEIINVMKKMSFEAVGFPMFESTRDYYESVARFRRAIDENDIL